MSIMLMAAGPEQEKSWRLQMGSCTGQLKKEGSRPRISRYVCRVAFGSFIDGFGFFWRQLLGYYLEVHCT